MYDNSVLTSFFGSEPNSEFLKEYWTIMLEGEREFTQICIKRLIIQ